MLLNSTEKLMKALDVILQGACQTILSASHRILRHFTWMNNRHNKWCWKRCTWSWIKCSFLYQFYKSVAEAHQMSSVVLLLLIFHQGYEIAQNFVSNEEHRPIPKSLRLWIILRRAYKLPMPWCLFQMRYRTIKHDENIIYH